MRIYISGIGGVAMGPLALLAKDLGYTVVGSNDVANEITSYLADQGIAVHERQDDAFLETLHAADPIDWFVHT